MSFGEPAVLWGLLVVPCLVWAMLQADSGVRRRLAQVVAPRLFDNLLEPVELSRQLLRRALLLAALTFFILALARPQWGAVEHPVVQKGREILLAIDTSKSMLAEDVVPNRLTRVKLAAEDLVRAMTGDRFGVIAFAGESQIQAPVTVDYPSILETIAALDTHTVERGGTDFASAIRAAQQAFGSQEGISKALVLLTDGEELDEDGLAAARKIAQDGVRIFTIGVGSAAGANIPDESGTLMRDREGNIVLSRMNPDFLRQLAEATGGFYVHLDQNAVARVANEGLRQISQGNFGDHTVRNPVERYRWPLALGLLSLLLYFVINEKRRPAMLSQKSLSSVGSLLIILAWWPEITLGTSALDLYQRGDFDGALNNLHEQLNRHPESPRLNYNAGDAAYRLERYDEAFEAFSKAMRSSDPGLRQKAYYNAGNSLFKEGDGQSEIERRLTCYYDARYLYHQSLDLNPQDEPTKKNLALLERRIKEAEEQKEQLRQQRARSSNRRKQPNNRGQAQSGQQGRRQISPNGEDQDQGNSDDDDNGSSDEQQPQPTPGKEKKGDVRENAPGDQTDKTPDSGSHFEGRMTPDEALGLLDSLQNEEDKVDLTHRKRERGVARDW